MSLNCNGLTYDEWLSSAGKYNSARLAAYECAWEAGADPCEWKVPSKTYLFGYYYDWQEGKPFTVLAVVMAADPIEAAEKYEAVPGNGYFMGEINLVGGAVWEAREVPVIL